MIRVSVRPPSPPPAPRLGILQRPDEEAATCHLLREPSMDEIKQLLGTKQPVRCFTRRDGLATAYCGCGGTEAVDNQEALQMARTYGIPMPDEALPLRGTVLFLGKLANL